MFQFFYRVIIVIIIAISRYVDVVVRDVVVKLDYPLTFEKSKKTRTLGRMTDGEQIHLQGVILPTDN